ncbi:MAG: hypothetical protein HS115_16600 [Spirochaetales bacterium]|nr:hypothetical protein [Spirochaetales bacterium]
MKLAFVSLITLSLGSGGLIAYTPGKWSPLDPYISGQVTRTPRELTVHDASGKVLQVARLEFAAGKLQKEHYVDAQGKPAGQTRYTYQNGLPVKEEQLNAAGQILGEKTIAYTEARPSLLRVFENGQLIQEISFKYAKGLLVEAREKSGDTEDIHSYIYKNDRLSAIHTRDEAGKEFHRIEYVYDDRGRLAERKRFSGDLKQTCRVQYDNGDLISYAYYDLQKNEWKLQKKLSFQF